MLTLESVETDPETGGSRGMSLKDGDRAVLAFNGTGTVADLLAGEDR